MAGHSDSDSSDGEGALAIARWIPINKTKSTATATISRSRLSRTSQSSIRSANMPRSPSLSPFRPSAQIEVVIPKLGAATLAEFEDVTSLAEGVHEILKLIGPDRYQVQLEDARVEELSTSDIQALDGGPEALELYLISEKAAERDDDFQSSSDEPAMSFTRPNSSRARPDAYMDIDDAIDLLTSSDERSRPLKRRRRGLASSDSDDLVVTRRSGRLQPARGGRTQQRITLRSTRAVPKPSADSEEEDEDGNDSDILRSDLRPAPSRKKKRTEHGPATRQSGRSTRHLGGMHEADVDGDFEMQDDKPGLPRAKGAAETFKQLPSDDPFRVKHMQSCDTCGSGSRIAPLIYCQGCTFAYHKACIGTRSVREHLVTKVGEDDFVLQCRRCICIHRKKDLTAPDQAMCQECKEPGESCRPWRTRKTSAQEQKDREDNDGQDPISMVPSRLVNNADGLLFRCVVCTSPYHFDHLPSRTGDIGPSNALRVAEYSHDWLCKICFDPPGKVGGLIAWKPVDPDIYDPTEIGEQVSEDNKTYLVRWENKSYLRATWMPGAWTWKVAPAAMRKAFNRREDALYPKMNFEDAVPEDLLRPDIVLDVRYTSVVDARILEVDKARIKEVDEALIKYKGLGYEDAVWEKPPSPLDGERWTDFVSAYNYWVLGKYVQQPKALPLKTRLEKARSLDFATKLERKTQPDNMIGGELMKYQLEGVNWLFYKWYTQRNAILADEMGLGKTIQIIGLLATLVSDWNCFPFLIVVPNSTCANWRREIKKWAPELRVVAYFGSRESRDLAYRYELYPQGRREIRCHVVVTSYEAAKDDNCRRFFRSVPWQALIVDEGQRIKNDGSQIYAALSALDIPFKVLMTGTPLQNNARELFNLLQFLDPTLDATQLELEFADLDAEKIAKLHEMIRPFFLRRTKLQVLTFLPPMAQIIVPVSMTTVTKKLYRSILAKSPDLLRAIFAAQKSKASDRGSLNNILMQLRKCLCHPFVYSQSIEDRNVSQAVSHRNLVEASAKLQFLELLLPKLKERGHRVLIFSQFLDMLSIVEDFLDDLDLKHARLDGTVSSLVKQKRIDAFNAPDSELFAFLLSTRAGGVGINLATADTVIIMDPDFNPHQDIQALSRAHRIGQKKKVSCYQLVTRASAEEKILQIGRKKMALDHVLVDRMDDEDADEQDLESILRHGAGEIFDDDGSKDIKYDAASIEKLLDRSDVEVPDAATDNVPDKSAETQFSRARVWAHNDLEPSLPDADTELVAPDPNVWEKILQERERIAAAEAAAAERTWGRGRRHKAAVDYHVDRANNADDSDAGSDAETTKAGADKQADKPKSKTRFYDPDNDTDFLANSDDSSSSEADEANVNRSLEAIAEAPKASEDDHRFSRVNVPARSALTRNGLPTPPPIYDRTNPANNTKTIIVDAFSSVPSILHNLNDAPSNARILTRCTICNDTHDRGVCPIHLAGVEHCNLCGIAHYASRDRIKTCPHLYSETQIRLMLGALKRSPEPRELVQIATKYLLSCKASIVYKKKQEEKARVTAAAAAAAAQASIAQAPMAGRALLANAAVHAGGHAGASPAVHMNPGPIMNHNYINNNIGHNGARESGGGGGGGHGMFGRVDAASGR